MRIEFPKSRKYADIKGIFPTAGECELILRSGITREEQLAFMEKYASDRRPLTKSEIRFLYAKRPKTETNTVISVR
jgi:hypothetical protein